MNFVKVISMKMIDKYLLVIVIIFICTNVLKNIAS